MKSTADMPTKTKILLITDNHIRKGGGAEKTFFKLKALLQQQSQFEVMSLGFGPKAAAGKDYVILPHSSSNLVRQWWNMFLHPGYYFKLRRIIKKFQPDVIHLHNVRRYTIALLKAVRGYPVVQTVHDFGLVCPTMTNIHQDLKPCDTGMTWRCWLQHSGHYSFPIYLGLLVSFYRMRKLLKKTVKHFMTPSPLLAEYLQKNFFTPVSYVPLFVKQSFPLTTPQPKHFLYVGQIQKNKGVHLLVDEFALACQQNDKQFILKIVGVGYLKNALEEKVRALGLEKNILFLGYIDDAEKLDALYQEACAVIFPSIGMESFGLVQTEAMNRGRTVIGCDRGTTRWLIEHEKMGLLFDPLQKGSLAACIARLGNDIELCCEYGKNAWMKMQNALDDQAVLNKVVDVYLSPCGSLRSSG